MMNQAGADLSTSDAANFDQADAGWEGAASGDPSEASASEAGSNDTHQGQPGAGMPGDPGQEVDLDIVDENHADIASYFAALDQLGASEIPDNLEFDPEVDRGFVDPAAVAPAAPPVAPAPPAAPAAPAPTVEPEVDARNWRLTAETDLEKRTFALMKTGLRLEEAVEAARKSLNLPAVPVAGEAPAASDPVAADPAAPALPALPEGAPATVAEAQALMRQLRRDLLTAKEEFDRDREIEIEKQMLDLEDTLPVLEATEAHRAELAEREETQWLAAANASLSAVVAIHPAAADPASSIRQRMDQIDEAWGEAGDPRYGHADKPEQLFRIVAKEFGLVAPASGTPAPAAPQTPSGGRQLPATASSRLSSPAPRPGSPVPIAPGAARTTTPDSLSSSVVARAQAIDDPMEFMALVEGLSGQ